MKNTDKTKRKLGNRAKVAVAIAGVVIAGGATVAVTSALAHGKGFQGGFGGQRPAVFERIDADGDKKVTMDEAAAFFAGIRDANDADGNGAINLEEFEGIVLEHARPMIAKGFMRLDDDGDGELSDAEIAERVEHMMERADRNGDGAVEIKELKRGRHGHGRGRHHGGGHKGGDDS